MDFLRRGELMTVRLPRPRRSPSTGRGFFFLVDLLIAVFFLGFILIVLILGLSLI